MLSSEKLLQVTWLLWMLHLGGRQAMLVSDCPHILHPLPILFPCDLLHQNAILLAEPGKCLTWLPIRPISHLNLRTALRQDEFLPSRYRGDHGLRRQALLSTAPRNTTFGLPARCLRHAMQASNEATLAGGPLIFSLVSGCLAATLAARITSLLGVLSTSMASCSSFSRLRNAGICCLWTH